MVEAEKMGIWKKLQDVDYRVIYLIGLLASFGTTLYPLGIPITVTESTNAFYKVIEDMPEGSTIILSIDFSPYQYPELSPGIRAFMVHALKNDLKVVLWFYNNLASPLWQNLLKDIPIPAGKEYGKDWVNLGYIPGLETAVAALAKNIHEVASMDYYNTPIENIPMMNNIKTGEDISLYCAVTGSVEPLEEALRQFSTTFKTPVICVAASVAFIMVSAYYPNQVLGVLNGVSGGAEYELLVKTPWKGLANTDGLSVIGLIILGFVIIGNIGEIVIKRREK